MRSPQPLNLAQHSPDQAVVVLQIPQPFTAISPVLYQVLISLKTIPVNYFQVFQQALLSCYRRSDVIQNGTMLTVPVDEANSVTRDRSRKD